MHALMPYDSDALAIKVGAKAPPSHVEKAQEPEQANNDPFVVFIRHKCPLQSAQYEEQMRKGINAARSSKFICSAKQRMNSLLRVTPLLNSVNLSGRYRSLYYTDVLKPPRDTFVCPSCQLRGKSFAPAGK